MRLSEKQSDFMWMVVDLLNFAREFFNHDNPSMAGVYLKVLDWNRTLAEQKEKVKQGVSWTLHSKHLEGLAVDLLLMRRGEPIYESPFYNILGEYWRGIGGLWGGEWKHRDICHFEYNRERRMAYLENLDD